MKHLLYILISLPILLFTSCDVHEWPDAPATEKLHLKLNYETHITNWVHLYDGDKVIEQGLGSSYDNSLDYGSSVSWTPLTSCIWEWWTVTSPMSSL